MIIREARTEDIERILEIYDIAKAFMRQTGNPHQWNSRYPDQITLEEDIHKHQLFVMEEESIIHTVFAFILGEDPTYNKIEVHGLITVLMVRFIVLRVMVLCIKSLRKQWTSVVRNVHTYELIHMKIIRLCRRFC